ncbi:MAG: 1-deoxy-D-xylulose-5-phosphate reductoisomerase [Gammaproteobacteria bacterium]
MTRLCVLGATGSVGGAALSVAREYPDCLAAEILAAGSNAKAMHALCMEFRPRRAVMHSTAAAEELRELLNGEGVEVDGGEEAVRLAAGECETVVAGISGAGGLPPVLEAARRGRRILLANKESLVIAGELLMRTAAQNGAQILPIDSEHAALFELLEGGQGGAQYARLWLTASGGALRDMPLKDLPHATPAQALAHPTWRMGRKITVDSATMMNKTLEILEAAALFGTGAEDIGVVLHPQSIVHAFVEYADGAMSAQLAAPDMRRPVARMLFWPDKTRGFCGKKLDWKTLSSLSFSAPDAARYPCLALAKEAQVLGGGAPAALSAANETAVESFLAGNIKFTDIARICARALEKYGSAPGATLEDVRAADESARLWAAALC